MDIEQHEVTIEAKVGIEAASKEKAEAILYRVFQEWARKYGYPTQIKQVGSRNFEIKPSTHD